MKIDQRQMHSQLFINCLKCYLPESFSQVRVSRDHENIVRQFTLEVTRHDSLFLLFTFNSFDEIFIRDSFNDISFLDIILECLLVSFALVQVLNNVIQLSSLLQE